MIKYKGKIIQSDLEKINNDKFLAQIATGSKIMITGCNGMIATYLLYYLLYLNDKYNKNLMIYAVTRNLLKTKKKFDDLLLREDVKFIEHNVNLEFDFDIKADYIFHLASSADPKNILNNPVDIIKANTIGVINVMEYARRVNSRKVIFSSTREVYGKMDDKCYEVFEDSLGIIDQLGIRACYPESKKMGECIVNSYNLQYGIPYVIFRIAHTYGPGMPISNDGRIMSDLINNVVNREDIILKSDGSAVRGFLYISDLISGMMYATFVGEDNTVYNICNEEENISVLDLAKKLIDLYPERNLNVSYKKISAQEREAYCKFKRVMMNTDRLRNLGWRPTVSLDFGLKNTINSYEGDD